MRTLAFALAGLLLLSPAFVSSIESICELRQADRGKVQSRSCVACHDGSLGPAAHFSLAAEGLGGAHPIDIDYERARARHPGRLVPAAQLPASLVLSDGRVTCATCHDGQAHRRSKVALSMDASSLCMSCHPY